MLGLNKDKAEEAPETDEEKLVHSIKLGILAMQRGDINLLYLGGRSFWVV